MWLQIRIWKTDSAILPESPVLCCLVPLQNLLQCDKKLAQRALNTIQAYYNKLPFGCQQQKSIFQKYTHNKIISTDDFNDDIKEAQESFNEIEQTTNQVIINKDILIAFCCFGKFKYTNKEDFNKIIEYLKKIVDIPTNQTTIIWLCQFELRRQLLSYLSEYNLMFDNDATYLDMERELLKSIASDQSNFEQVKTIYGIKER